MEAQQIFSKEGKFLIFMHSKECPISRGIMPIIEKYRATPESLEVITVDVINQEKLKIDINSHYNIFHKSPQLILIDAQKCTKILPPSRIFLKAIKEL